MTNFRAERHRILVATLASALTGATLTTVLFAFHWPRPVIDWMRVMVPSSDFPMTAGFALTLVRGFLIITLLLAAVVPSTRWVLHRLGITSPATVLATILIVVFALIFTTEAVSQVMRASGDLTASDATGFIIDDGRLTAHGWETIARRASAAAVYAGIMALAFRVAASAWTKRVDPA